MRKAIFILILTPILLLFTASISSAQSKKTSHHIDFLQVGKTSGGSLAVIAGYHFTTLKVKRFRTLGLGVASLGANSTDSTSSYQDIALTTPLVSILISRPPHSDKVPSPTFFFNVNYGYGLIHEEHGLFVGISFGSGEK